MNTSKRSYTDQHGRSFELIEPHAPDPPSYFADSAFLVPFDGSFSMAEAKTVPPEGALSEKDAKEKRKKLCEEIAKKQDALFAYDRVGLTLALQGMDASGKGSLIRRLTENMTAGGCRVTSFKAPHSKELDQDFMRRIWEGVAHRGIIAFLDRSHLEEVLVVRVHPQYLESARLPQILEGDLIWAQRYQAIRHLEWYLAHQGFPIIKFWLHVSKEEQAKRLIKRATQNDKQYKYSERDITETIDHWDEYQFAAQEALRHLSTPWAPCYCIPADEKEYAAVTVAEIVLQVLSQIDPRYPSLSPEELLQKTRFVELLQERIAKSKSGS